jgi:class 3 adenylate cyclase
MFCKTRDVMGITNDLHSQVAKLLQERWRTIDGRVVPDPASVSFGNDGVVLDAACLYADLADSTGLIEQLKATESATVIRAFLYCAAKVIRELGGSVTAFDGDRVMAVFIGERKETSAARAALAISDATTNIVLPRVATAYGGRMGTYRIRCGIGVDTGPVLVAKAGFRNADDLVWVGQAANRAAKLSSLRDGANAIWITQRVFQRLSREVMISSGNQQMWTAATVPGNPAETVFRSNWTWQLPA